MQERTKLKLLIIFLFLAVLGLFLPGTTTTGVQWVVNNTNLAPTVAGEPVGTGERIADNTTYWANNSPIQIFLYAHADTPATAAEVHFFINGTKVGDDSGRPLGVAEENNRTIIATIPQYANYSALISNYHHYEWREYPILTGTVTTTITTSTGGGTTGAGCVGHSGNCSFDMVLLNHLAANTTGGFVNILLHDGFENNSGNFHNVLDITGATISMISSEVVGVNSTQLTMTPTNFLLQNTNSINNYFLATQNEIVIASGSANYSFNQTDADWHTANLTGLNNTNMTGSLHIKGEGVMNLTTTNSFNFDFGLVPRLFRNVTSTSTRTSPLATLNMILGIDTGYIDNGGGPAVIFWNKDNVSAGSTEYNIGRVAAVWANRTKNTSSVDFYARSGIIDNNAVSKVLTAYTNEYNVFGGDTIVNATVETGNLKLDNMTGAGNAYVCVDANGRLFRGSPGC